MRRLDVWAAWVLAFAVGLVGCSDDAGSRGVNGDAGRDAAGICSEVDGRRQPEWAVRPSGIGLGVACSDAWVELLPRVLVDGAWRGGGDDGACEVADGVITCPAGEAGSVSAEMRGGATVVVRFEAVADAVFEAVELAGDGEIPGATGWLSNGFQSWSQSGIVALREEPSEEALAAALDSRGDAEVIRSGRDLSWFYTAVGGGDDSLVIGALSAEVLKPWLQVHQREDGRLGVRLVAGGTGEAVSVEVGDVVESPPWYLDIDDDVIEMLDWFSRSLPTRGEAEAEAGWNSWYELWDDVDAEAVLANAAEARALIQPVYGLLGTDEPPLRIVVDDGWQQLWGEWVPNDKFPEGLEGVATTLQTDGFSVGVWLAPFLVDADSDIVDEHPDWLVDDAVYNHALNGPMRVLDPTHPEVAAHLSETIERIVGWGFDFLKIDFLFAGTWEGGRYADVTGMQAYHEGMRIIRQAAGDDVVLLAVAGPPIATFPYVDAWRVGWDIALETFGPSWPFVQSQARSLAVRWPLCRAVLCDADPVLLRGLPRNEVEVGSWVVALSGGGWFLSDDLRELDEQRSAWGLDIERVRWGTSGQAGRPVDFFPEAPPARLTNAFTDQLRGEASHVVPSIWERIGGDRVLINWGDVDESIDGVEVPARSAVVELEDE